MPQVLSIVVLVYLPVATWGEAKMPSQSLRKELTIPAQII